MAISQARKCSRYELARHVELRGEGSLHFLEADLADHELVLGQDEPQDVRAETPCRERAHDHVRVEEDLQETSRNTSASVRKPAASANGIMRSRSASNAMTSSCRRSASRTISLRVRPV